MIAVRHPVEANGVRQGEPVDFAPIPEWVSLPLADAAAGSQCLEVFGSQTIRLAGGMERVAQADEATDLCLVCDQTGHATTERLAANGDSIPRVLPEFSAFELLAVGIQ